MSDMKIQKCSLIIVVLQLRSLVCQKNDQFLRQTISGPQSVVSTGQFGAQQKAIAREIEENSEFEFVDPICLDDTLWNTQVTKIVGGSMGDASRWPYLVSLQMKNNKQEFRHFCAGVMVAPNTLLTTAHCIRLYRESESSFNGSLTTDIYVALRPQCRHQEGLGRRKVTGFIIHPEYSAQDINHDIALLWLEPLKENSAQHQQWNNFANYKSSQQYSGDILQQNILVSTMGWGGMGYKDSTALLFNSRMVPLQYATMKVISKSECDTEILNSGVGGIVRVEDDTMICAKSFMGEDTCDGDSGGPLLIPDMLGNPKMDIIVGLTSWGPDTICGGDLVLPGVYTKLSSFVDWIDSAILDLENMMLNSAPVENYSGQFESSASSSFLSYLYSSATIINISLYTNFQLPVPLMEKPPFSQNPSENLLNQNSQLQEVKSDQLLETQQEFTVAATEQFTVYIEEPKESSPSLSCQVKSILQNSSRLNCD